MLCVIHASIPNHWVPLIALGKAEGWTRGQTLWSTAIAGFAHMLSTIIIGIIVGFIGYKLADAYELIAEIVAPSILVILGIVYIAMDRMHAHHHHLRESPGTSVSSNSKWVAITTSLSVAMFLTPCVEVEAYYFQAGTYGWMGILVVSLVYMLTTLMLMLLLVFLGMKGINRFRSHYLDHHAKQITGIVLVILGVTAYFVH